MGDYIDSQDLRDLLGRVSQEYKNKVIYPPKKLVFRALILTPLSNVKCVILGQDPYYSGYADGLAFSTSNGYIPPSLESIYKELLMEGIDVKSNKGNLQDWAKQGVLLLNTCLTVEKNKPLSHKDIGWDAFIFNVLKALNTLDRSIWFLLWGKSSEFYLPLIDTNKHKVLKASHPSPRSAHISFLGCEHFKKVNEGLISQGDEPIIW